jgi:hypothetical protein
MARRRPESAAAPSAAPTVREAIGPDAIVRLEGWLGHHVAASDVGRAKAELDAILDRPVGGTAADEGAETDAHEAGDPASDTE